jgi:hypothetical protein
MEIQSDFQEEFITTGIPLSPSYQKMSDSLTEDEIAELVRHGRISTSKSAIQRQRRMKPQEKRNERPTTRKEATTVVPESPKSNGKLDPEWLKAQKEKAETNVAAQRLNKRQREEMQEASKF